MARPKRGEEKHVSQIGVRVSAQFQEIDEGSADADGMTTSTSMS